MTTRVEQAGPLSPADYFADTNVRKRIVEYCGGSPTQPPTAAYIAWLEPTHPGEPSWDRVVRIPSSRVSDALARRGDIARSLWDAEHLLFFLELDHLNTDAAAEPFLHPLDVLIRMEPVYLAARDVFDRFHLGVRAFVTGRGYHFVGQIRLDDPLIDELAGLVPGTPPWFAGVESRRPAEVTAPLTERHARAADGLGCLVEYAAHLVLEESRDSRVPVVFNGTAVGHTGPWGRECVSIDFSHAGDPLDVRHARAGFSTYQWHRTRPDIFGARAASLEPFVALPRGRKTALTRLARGRDLAAGVAAARAGRARIPDVRTGLAGLLAAYEGSLLGDFHRRFYAELAAPAAGPIAARPAGMPACVAAALGRPNDLLLKPEHIQHAVRWLMSRRWTPASIARLIQSLYEADHRWGDRWTARMHPRARAEFEVRVFAGLIETGADGLIDFNCVSAQEKNLCPRVACQGDLRVDRDALVHSL